MKRKHTSNMIHAIPLPALKAKKNHVNCAGKCGVNLPKSEMDATQSIIKYWYCKSCKAKYAGKLKFIVKNIDKTV